MTDQWVELQGVVEVATSRAICTEVDGGTRLAIAENIVKTEATTERTWRTRPAGVVMLVADVQSEVVQ